MARVTESEVKAICGTGLTEEQISPYLCTASTLVDSLLASAGYGTDHLAKIELWLAAHFTSVRDPQVKSEQIGEVNVTYHGNIISQTGLKFTAFGQQALALEYKGILAALSDSKGSAEMRVIG